MFAFSHQMHSHLLTYFWLHWISVGKLCWIWHLKFEDIGNGSKQGQCAQKFMDFFSVETNKDERRIVFYHTQCLAHCWSKHRKLSLSYKWSLWLMVLELNWLKCHLFVLCILYLYLFEFSFWFILQYKCFHSMYRCDRAKCKYLGSR